MNEKEIIKIAVQINSEKNKTHNSTIEKRAITLINDLRNSRKGVK